MVLLSSDVALDSVLVSMERCGCYVNISLSQIFSWFIAYSGDYGIIV